MFQLHPVQVGYGVVFGLAAVGCFVAAYRARRIVDTHTRWGLVTFLFFVGWWGVFEMGRVVIPSVEVKVTLYVLGLVVGLAAGGSWLYFASAYAGYDYHQNATYRRLAVLVFVVLVTVKITNPLHGRYFSARVVDTPFPHLVVEQGAPHWAIAALLYVVAAIGFYMIFQLFVDSHVSTTSLGVVVMLAGLPALLDVFGYLQVGGLLELNYEPIGVAAFGIGALYFVEESFIAVRGFGRQEIVDNLTEAVVLVDTSDRIQDYNERAAAVFPDLEGSRGASLDAVLPVLATAEQPRRGSASFEARSQDDAHVLELDRNGSEAYYLTVETPIEIGPHTIGRALVFTDVTRLERQRRELDRQNEQLDDFAVAIAHELRNTLAVVSGNLDLADSAIEIDDTRRAKEAITVARENANDVGRVVDDLARIARYSQTVSEPPTLDFRAAVSAALERTDTGELSCEVEGDGEIVADESRFEETLRNTVRFARRNGATGLSVALIDGGFRVTVLGAGLSIDESAGLFEYGTAVPNAETGLLAANLQTLSRAHGWSIEAHVDGTDVSFVFTGVTVNCTA